MFGHVRFAIRLFKINMMVALAAVFFLLISVSATFAVQSVACVQAGLTRFGFDPGPVDGLMGGRTANASIKFLAQTGVDLPPLKSESSERWCIELRTFARTQEAKALGVVDLQTQPRGVLSSRQSENLWTAYQRASTCGEHPSYGSHPRFRISPPTALSAAAFEWVSPFTNAVGNRACLGDRPNFSWPPEPIPVVSLNEAYGETQMNVKIAASWFTKASTFVRASDDSVARRVIIDTLLNWAENDSLGKGIRVSWGNQPVDYQMMATIAALVTATAEVSSGLSAQERSIIGPWLGKLVQQASESRWKDRQDNKEYQRTYLGLLWALLTGDDQGVQDATSVFKLAIHDIRPDGSYPIDSQRSAMGLQYNSASAEYLVLAAAALKEARGVDLFSYQVDGRSGHDVVDFVVQSIKTPSETNLLYAISCQGGGDRFGTIENPNLYFIEQSQYLIAYALLYPSSETSRWIRENYDEGSNRAIISDAAGGAPACQFGPAMGEAFSLQPVVLQTAPEISLPEPEYKVITIEELANSSGRSSMVNSLLGSHIVGASGGDSLDFNIVGNFSFSNSDFTYFRFIINPPLGSSPPDSLVACQGATTVTYDDAQHRAVISFSKRDGEWVSVGGECIVNALPPTQAFMAKFLMNNFADIAIGMVRDGSVKSLQHEGLTIWLERVAKQEIRVRQ